MRAHSYICSLPHTYMYIHMHVLTDSLTHLLLDYYAVHSMTLSRGRCCVFFQWITPNHLWCLKVHPLSLSLPSSIFSSSNSSTRVMLTKRLRLALKSQGSNNLELCHQVTSIKPPVHLILPISLRRLTLLGKGSTARVLKASLVLSQPLGKILKGHGSRLPL